MRIVRLTEETKSSLLEDLLKRSPNHYTEYEARVAEIIEAVREKGDEALFAYTKKFDRAEIDASNIRVTEEEIRDAYERTSPELVEVIRKALVNIRSYHEKQRRYSWFDSTPEGTILGQKVAPLAVAGVYVPGGKAVYPSSVLMNVVPAKVAGVERVIMTTPCDAQGRVNPATLVAAKEAGADEIYKAGGAQAIAAMAFGTESIPKVDKIVGPGNIYVALAKKAVYGYVSIDSIAGPSEILVLADETANPRYVAADLLSQAEHDELASAILITTSGDLAEKVSQEVDGFLKELSRREIIEKSLDNYGYILVADTMEDAVEAANAVASEHLEIVTKGPLPGDDENQKRRRHLPWRIQQRASGGLFRGAQPHPSHKRDGPVLLTPWRGRFYEKVQHHLLFQGCPGKGTKRHYPFCRERAAHGPCQFHQGTV